MTERMSPPVTDSDIMFLAIKRLERVAEKMMKLEYDEELDHHMIEAAALIEEALRLDEPTEDGAPTWAAFNIARRHDRENGIEVPEGEDDVDPFERAAIIAETLQGVSGPATGDQIAQALRAWKRLPKPAGREDEG